MTDPTTEQIAAGAVHGFTPAQSAALCGTTLDELLADAEALRLAFPTPAAESQPGFRPSDMSVGGARGVDVGSEGGTPLAKGAALYNERHGLNPDGTKPEKAPRTGTPGQPFAELTYSFR
ncbi:hypothetical protein [Streptomyces sp. NBC_00344]|uniref:hypothetical protein n=1 Tax=Streptomyces sp. NBC_00344 TaxID=2975720 RepID=UPI002E1E518D